jgi:hypothetical protein
MTETSFHNANALNDFDSTPFLHMELNEGLESILIEEKPEKKKSSLEAVFADKSKTSKAGVKALLSEIKLRQLLNLHLMNNIDNDISKQNSQLMQLENISYPSSMEFSEDINQKSTRLKENILELQREKRKEYLECWKDLMLLKKYLQVSLKEYWNHAKKRDVLSGVFDE